MADSSADVELSETPAPPLSAEKKKKRQSSLIKVKDETPPEEFTGPRECEGDDTLWSWDYVLVFKKLPAEEKQKKQEFFRSETARYQAKIKKAGFHTTTFYSVQNDEVYLLIGATEKRLRWEADRRDIDLPLNTDEVIKQGVEAGMALAIAAQDNKAEENALVRREDWQKLYGKYNRFNREHPHRHRLYEKPDPATLEQADRHPDTLFRSIDRLRLTYLILQEEEELHGAGLRIERDLTKGKKGKHPLIACFPAHELQKKKDLEEKWMVTRPFIQQPLAEIRDYFGEKVAFYFAYLESYCYWLIPIAFIGVIFFCWQMGKDKVDIEVLPFFGVCMALWATLFLDFWKRRESKLRSHWGMDNYENTEGMRAEFIGQKRRNPVNGKWTKIFPSTTKLVRFCLSQTVVWTLITVVIAAVVSIFFLRKYLTDQNVDGWQPICSIINAIQIQILNYVYGAVSLLLNEYENHRTPSEYENALIAKNFLFKFVNSYNSLFYIAFGKRFETGASGCPADDPNCLQELQIQLGILFGVQIFVSNFIELGIPFIKTRIAAFQNTNIVDAATKTAKPKTRYEEEFELEPFTTFAEFDEMVVQFGYVTLFVVAFPLAPLGALLNNYVEIRLDAHKILTLSQRPRPLGAVGIGTWFQILEILSYIAVVVNTLIVIFSVEIIDEWAEHSNTTKCWIFIVLEHLVIVMKFLVSYAVSDESGALRDHLDRQRHIVAVLIDDIPEEEDELLEDKDEDEETPDKQFGMWNYEGIAETFVPSWKEEGKDAGETSPLVETAPSSSSADVTV